MKKHDKIKEKIIGRKKKTYEKDFGFDFKLFNLIFCFHLFTISFLMWYEKNANDMTMTFQIRLISIHNRGHPTTNNHSK